jgi:predicted transposase/invertase (TIGR01784 family)
MARAQKHIRFDWAMKRLLRNKSNFEILEGFLSELLKIDIKIQEILESEGNQKYEDDKYNRVDILVKNEKDELILVEIQNDSQSDYFHRMNYGQAKLLTDHIDLGQKYSEIKKIYSINIVYFDLGQGDDYVYVGKTDFKGLHNEDVLQLSENQKDSFLIKDVSDIFTTYYILKINKFDDVAKNTLDEWIYFLKHSEIKEEFKAKGLKKAKNILRIDNLPEKDRKAFYNYIENWRIRESEIETALYKGKKKAEEKYLPLIEKAIQKEREAKQKELEAKQKELEAKQKLIETARFLKQQGIDDNKISEITGLDKEEIGKL